MPAILLCQNDPYRREAPCQILSIQAEGSAFWVEIDDSPLYPEGGGQPADHGSIQGVQVVDVRRSPQGTVLCKTFTSLPLGDALVSVDWERRFDHMQQHSAQHLLTALADDHLGLPTVAFHLGDTVSTIELQTPDIRDEELQRLVSLAHDAIRKSIPIRASLVEPSEISAQAIRSRGLPEGHQGPIRLVSIEGIDLNTCGGTHLASTAEIQAIAILGFEKLRGHCRISYLAGQRVFARFAQQLQRERELSTLLSCGPAEQIEIVKKTQADLRKAEKNNRDLQDEISSFLARDLAATPGLIRSLHRPGADLASLEAIAKAASHLAPDALFFLTASPADQGEGLFLLAGPPDRVRSLGPSLASILQGRGGGRPGRFQGKAGRIEARHDALSELSKGAL